MAQLVIDLRKEAEECRAWLEAKTAAAAPAFSAQAVSIGQIVCMYNFDQGGWLGLDFDTADPIQQTGDMSKAAWNELYPRPSWTPFFESEGTESKTFIRTNGTQVSFLEPPRLEEFISVQLSTMLAEVFTTAWTRGIFAGLPLHKGCEISIGDFNGWWGWAFRENAGELEQIWPVKK